MWLIHCISVNYTGYSSSTPFTAEATVSTFLINFANRAWCRFRKYGLGLSHRWWQVTRLLCVRWSVCGLSPCSTSDCRGDRSIWASPRVSTWLNAQICLTRTHWWHQLQRRVSSGWLFKIWNTSVVVGVPILTRESEKFNTHGIWHVVQE